VAKTKTVRRKKVEPIKPTGFKMLYVKIMENIKLLSVFSFVFMVIGFFLGVYSDVMRVDGLEKEVSRLNLKIDNLVELIIGSSSDKFDEQKGKAPKLEGLQ